MKKALAFSIIALAAIAPATLPQGPGNPCPEGYSPAPFHRSVANAGPVASLCIGNDGSMVPDSRVFNVKLFGAKGDTRWVEDAVTFAGGNPRRITSATANFSTDDVGKRAWASDTTAIASVPFTTILRVISPTEIEVADNATTSGSGRFLVWGTDDSQAFRDAVAAARAHIRAGELVGLARGATLYIPAGGYMLSGQGEVIDQSGGGFSNGTNRGALHVIGAGSQATFLFAAPNMTVSADNRAFFNLKGDETFTITSGFTVHGANTQYNSGRFVTCAWNFATGYVFDVHAWRWGGINNVGCGLRFASWTGVSVKVQSGETGGDEFCIIITGGAGPQDHYGMQTNNGRWLIDNITTSPIENGHGINFWGGMFDETSFSAQLTITNSRLIRFFGTRHFLGLNDGIVVTSNSEVWFHGSRVRKFGDQAVHNNQDAIDIDSTSRVWASQSLFKGYGTGVGVRSAGEFIDLGGNEIINGTAGAGFGVTFANLGNFLTANGQMIFCRDCTIANPCASGGTGAIAKRLNGINVCN